jgi:hypothetical protein
MSSRWATDSIPLLTDLYARVLIIPADVDHHEIDIFPRFVTITPWRPV